MIQNRIDQIEAKVQGASNIPDDTKAQLLSLLGDLKNEIASGTHDEEAHEKMDAALTGLTGPVSGFETTHPRLTEIVNRLAATLSNVGI